MFRKTKELQSLVNARTIALDKAERKIEDMNIVIATLENQENLFQQEKKNLKRKNINQEILINKISKLLSSNKYNNEKVILGKIKELVNDYQSNN